MFHHAALQHTPMQKHLSYLNTGASNFHLLQPAQRPPTHRTCCTVKHHLNKPQLETKFGARPTGSKRHCFYLNRWCFLSMGSQRVRRHWATDPQQHLEPLALQSSLLATKTRKSRNAVNVPNSEVPLSWVSHWGRLNLFNILSPMGSERV